MLLDDLPNARPEANPAVALSLPDIAVDGASIMLEFQALLPEVDGLAVYIEANPRPLAAAFYLAPEILPEMKLMVRLAQSSNVSIVVRSQGRFYRKVKFVKVTRGGCSDNFEVAEPKRRR
jgi:sulfur-oxidizing protein SoxY